MGSKTENIIDKLNETIKIETTQHESKVKSESNSLQPFKELEETIKIKETFQNNNQLNMNYQLEESKKPKSTLNDKLLKLNKAKNNKGENPTNMNKVKPEVTISKQKKVAYVDNKSEIWFQRAIVQTKVASDKNNFESDLANSKTPGQPHINEILKDDEINNKPEKQSFKSNNLMVDRLLKGKGAKKPQITNNYDKAAVGPNKIDELTKILEQNLDKSKLFVS